MTFSPRALEHRLDVVVPPGCTALRFSARRRRSLSTAQRRLQQQHESHLVNKNNSRFEMKLQPLCADVSSSLIEAGDDIVEGVKRINPDAFTDEEAVFLTSPDAPHCHIVEELMDALFENLRTTTKRCRWNTPIQRPEWNGEFRLMHEWWLSLRILSCTAAGLQERYPPLIPWSMRSKSTENQFFSDIALHMRKKKAVLSLLHIDHVTLTPGRVSVLLFDGIFRNKARVLECVSFSFCEIGPAALLVLLCGLYYCRAHQPQLRSLNLSYNWIGSNCSHMLATLLTRTSVRRLSLRGNRFGGGDMSTFQEFLLEGCMLLAELDLSYTCLTRAEVSALIRCLPQLPNLEVLLLDGVDVPESKAVALSTAIRQSKIIYVSLKCIPACSGEVYLRCIWCACQRNRAARNLPDGGTMQRLSNGTSFFEAFWRRACNRAMYNSNGDNNVIRALPASYRPFTTNEPSLHGNSMCLFDVGEELGTLRNPLISIGR